MTTSEDFVNWLEGFLDACKDAPTTRQIKEVRKKLSTVQQLTEEHYQSLWDPSMATQPAKAFSTITLVQAQKDAAHTKNPQNEDFIRAIEEGKNATTMEELNS